MKQIFNQFSKLLDTKGKFKFWCITFLYIIGAFLEMFSISLMIPYILMLANHSSIYENTYARALLDFFQLIVLRKSPYF